MAFINNWASRLEFALASGTGQSLPVPPDDKSRLAGGVYLLTLSDEGQQVEIIEYDGTQDAITARGLEGTQERAWPADAVIYAAVTAGQLTGILSAIEQLEVSVTSLAQRVDVLEQQGGDAGSRTITVEASPDNSTDAYEYGFREWLSFGAVSDKNIDGRGEISELFWSESLVSGAWWRYMTLHIENGTDLDLVTAAKVTINSTVFTLDAYAGDSSYVRLNCQITEGQFNSLPQSGDHAFQVELLP
ncbi:MAG: hypothetical protein GXZ05_09795 [Gammaproteobacteria bacterium]|nr:hypothetical protein [Gammaproteobacteria bacterium]